jgi:hypothetical protein
VYVADTNNNRVQRFDPQPGYPANCAAAGSWPPAMTPIAPTAPPPVVPPMPPKLSLKVQRRTLVLSLHDLTVAVTCTPACTASATATLVTAHSPIRRVTLLARRGARVAGRPVVLRMRLTARAVAMLRKALHKRRGLTATVHVTAKASNGLSSSATRTYSVTR